MAHQATERRGSDVVVHRPARRQRWQHRTMSPAEVSPPDGAEPLDDPNVVDAAAHQRRRLSFGARADAYDRYRPSYPTEAITWALGNGLVEVCELGAGTGLMTDVLLTAGHRVTAVEPDPGMVEQLRGRKSARLTVELGGAEEIPLPDRSVDAVLAAQAFHWFDLPRAVPEMARVLRPGGRLVIVWNVRDDDEPWVSDMSRIVGRLDARSGTRDLGVPEISSHFGDIEVDTFAHDQQLTPDDLVALCDTFSYVATSPRREEILGEIRRLALEHPDLAGRETFALPYRTTVYRATRRDL
jgi:SAM-dependent methyltransferase